MAQSSFKLALQIGASIGPSFQSSIKGSQHQLTRLGSTIKTLKQQQGLIRKVELGEASVGKARVAYEAASRELAQLRREVGATDQPSRQLTQAFEAAKRKTERLSNALGTQRERLQKHKRQLTQAGLSTRELASEHARLGSSVDRLQQKYKKLGTAMNAQQANKNKRADLRGQLFDAVALGTVVAAPLTVAIDFEASVAKLGAITRATEPDLKKLEGTARRLGEATQFSASQATEGMTFLGMAGFTTNEIIAATPGMLSLAQAAGSELADTADIASNVLSGFSLEAQEMGRVGDVLSATFTTSNTTLQMLGDTLKYAAPIASSTSTSIESVAAMAGLLGNVGIQGTQAGTTLRTALLRLSAPPKKAADALSSLGVEVKDLDGNLRPVPTLLKELANATDNLGSADKAQAITQIFGKEASAGLTELLKQASSGALDDYIEQLEEADGTANAMAETMSNNTRGSLKRLGSAVESVSISIGSLLLPTIIAGAEQLASMATWISRAAQEYPTLTTVIVGVTVGLVTLKVTAIASAYAFTFLKGGVLALATAYRVGGAAITLMQLGMIRINAMAAISAARMGIVTAAQWALNIAMNANPLGLVVAGVAALIGVAYLLIKYWEPISTFFKAVWTAMKSDAEVAINWLLAKMELLNKPFQALGDVWAAVSSVFGGGGQALSAHIDKQQTVVTQAKTVGESMVAQSTLGMPDAALDNLPPLATVNTSHQQRINIEAPITINATPGMDEHAVAEEVQKALAAQQARVASQQRGALYDEP